MSDGSLVDPLALGEEVKPKYSRALSYLCVPKEDVPQRKRAASAEARPRDRMRRHRNGFRSATPRSHRSKLTRTGRKTRVWFFRV